MWFSAEFGGDGSRCWRLGECGGRRWPSWMRNKLRACFDTGAGEMSTIRHPGARQPSAAAGRATRQPQGQAAPPGFVLWTVHDVARFARCSVRHVGHLREAGMPFIKFGHLVRFHPPLVIGWLMSHASGVSGEVAS